MKEKVGIGRRLSTFKCVFLFLLAFGLAGLNLYALENPESNVEYLLQDAGTYSGLVTVTRP
jgi:hypothetical protein